MSATLAAVSAMVSACGGVSITIRSAPFARAASISIGSRAA